MKKYKTLSLLLLFVGVFSIITTGFSAYKISNTKSVISVPLKQIEVINRTQKFFIFDSNSYNNNLYNNSLHYSNDKYKFITKDTMSFPFSVKKTIANTSQANISASSGIKINLKILDKKLYEHVRYELLSEHEFIKFKVGSKLMEFDQNTHYFFNYNNKKIQCFTANDSLNLLTIRLPFKINANGFFLFKNDPNPSANYDWNINFLFDFDLLDDNFSKDFTYANFNNGSNSLLNIKMEFENY